MGRVEIAERTGSLVSLTEPAAVKVRELMADEPEGEATVLRIAVQGGGCSGFEYALGFDSGAQEGDHEVEFHGVNVVVDPFSAPYLGRALGNARLERDHPRAGPPYRSLRERERHDDHRARDCERDQPVDEKR